MTRIIIEEPKFERLPTKQEIELALETVFPEFTAINLVKADHSRANYVAHAKNRHCIDLVCHIPNPDTDDAETNKFRKEIEIADILSIFFANNYSRVIEKGQKNVSERNYASAFLGFVPKNEQVLYFTREQPKGKLARDIICQNAPFRERVRALYNLIQAVERSHSEGFIINNIHDGNVLVSDNVKILNLSSAYAGGDAKADVKAIGTVGYKLLSGKNTVKNQPYFTGYASLDFPVHLAMRGETDIREMKKDIGKFYRKYCA